MAVVMNGSVRLREASSVDRAEVGELCRGAFAEEESASVATLATTLMEHVGDPPVLALVAQSDAATIAGFIAFSPLQAPRPKDWQGYLLAPLAVAAASQRAGIGSALVRAGLGRLTDVGVTTVMVYGDPTYYGRFGFEAATAEPFLPPYPLQYPFGWLALHLGETDSPQPPVPVEVVDALRCPTLW